MKNFESYLRRSVRSSAPGRADWSEHYVDYSSLKGKIREYARKRAALRALYRGGGVGSGRSVAAGDDDGGGDGGVRVTEADLRLLGCVGGTSSSSAAAGGGKRSAGAGGGEGDHDHDHDHDECFQYADAGEQASHVDLGEAMSRLSRVERSEFCGLLDGEISKAATFYSTQLVFLAKSIARLDGEAAGEAAAATAAPAGGEGGGSPSSASLHDDAEAASPNPTAEAGDEILEVFAFVVVNVITLRQILIRYDGFVRTHDGLPLSQWYLRRHSGRREDHIQGLFHLDALDALERSFAEKARRRTEGGGGSGGIAAAAAPSAAAAAALPESRLAEHRSQYENFSRLLVRTLESVERAAGGHIVWRDRFVASLRYYFLLGSRTKGLSMEPAFLLLRGRHLKEEIKAVAKWRETRSLGAADAGGREEGEGGARVDPENVVPLVLNLASCFLYLMNNYIIEPSSAYYANALGSNDALSGVLIGTSPWFALVSSIGYSFWTNYSYRQPILFAGMLMMVGNFMYGAAYAWGRSMTVCLLGRALTGLGAPRVINRRYIADSTPFALRTAASAAFAMATAVGAAMGPGAAILLDMAEFEFSLPVLGRQYFNGMTGPGYFMCLCWGVYLLCAAVWLREPSRSGIDELKKREEAEAEAEAEAAASAVEAPGRGSPLAAADGDSSDETNAKLGGKSMESFNDNDLEIEQETEALGKSSGGVFRCFKHLNRATLICMALIFMKRISLESVVGSTSVITKNRYSWSIRNVGLLHFVNGIIVIPISALAGWLSQFYEDRYLAIWFLSITLCGMVFLIDLTDFVSAETGAYNEGHWLAVGPVKYIAGSIIAFSGIEACESFVASLMSKVVPSALAVGTFNSGLLETLVGTSGRATGDMIITAMGLISLRHLLNLLVVPAALLVIISIALIRRNYEILAL